MQMVHSGLLRKFEVTQRCLSCSNWPRSLRSAEDDLTRPTLILSIEMNEEEILSGAPSPVSLAFRGVSYSVPVDRGRARKDKLERQRKETERYGSAGRTNKTYLNQLRGWLKRTSRKEETLKVLHSVDGLFPPGRLSAIMGPSGGGKSSLLDVLAGRNKLGTVEGDVLIAGNHLKELKEGTLQSLAGYVMQDDAFLSNLTVKETLEFALRFRVASSLLTDKLVDSTVDSLLALLNLTSVANSHVGSPLKRGISGGERRRLSIGCELTVRPPLLFLDEPTSGLDASNALRIMRLLRTLANSGHTIIASIHQPRSSIFKMFDRVLVLDHGKEAYFGPGGDECVENLQTFSGKECGRWENPADWLIDLLEEDGFDDLDEKVDSEEARAGLTGFGNATAHESEGSNGTANGTSHIVELQRKSLTETYSNSTLHASLLSSLSDLERTPLPSPIPPPTFSTLLKLCTKRQFLQTLRDPGIVYIRTGAALAIGILVGLIFFRQDQSVPAGRVNALLFLMCVFGLFCLVCAASRFGLAARRLPSTTISPQFPN